MFRRTLPLFACIALISFGVATYAAEKKISKDALPAAVQQTAEAQSAGATVTGYSQDREGGKLEYEVEMTVAGHSRDVTIAPDGQVLEVEEQVEFSTLAPSVQAALHNKAGHGLITQVEALTKHGTLVAYEAQVRRGTSHFEVQVGPQGQALAHEE
jgi:hypothetical protein